LNLVEESEKSIWIPGFKINHRDFYQNISFLKDLENLVLTKNDINYKLSQLLECKKFEFIYNDDCQNSFQIKQSGYDNNEIVIKKDFICGNYYKI